MADSKCIKSGPEVVQEFITRMAKDPKVDPATIKAVRDLIAADGKVSITKLQRELELLRKG